MAYRVWCGTPVIFQKQGWGTAGLPIGIYQQGSPVQTLGKKEGRGKRLGILPAVTSQAPCPHLLGILSPFLAYICPARYTFLISCPPSCPCGFFPICLNTKFQPLLLKASWKFFLWSCPHPMTWTTDFILHDFIYVKFKEGKTNFWQ